MSHQFGGMIGSSGTAVGARGGRGGAFTITSGSSSGVGASSNSRGPIGCGKRNPTIGAATRVMTLRIGAIGDAGGGGGGGGARRGALIGTSGSTVGSGGANDSDAPPLKNSPPGGAVDWPLHCEN